MRTITIKVFELCSDFDDDMIEEMSEYGTNDSYIMKTAYTKQYLQNKGFSEDLVANRLIDLGCNNGEEVLIHLDW